MEAQNDIPQELLRAIAEAQEEVDKAAESRRGPSMIAVPPDVALKLTGRERVEDVLKMPGWRFIIDESVGHYMTWCRAHETEDLQFWSSNERF